jgi:hypothetical protein
MQHSAKGAFWLSLSGFGLNRGYLQVHKDAVRRLLAFAMLSLSGCATFSLEPLNSRLEALKGQPVEAAFKQLGFPDRQGLIAGRTVYYWGGDQSTCQIRIIATQDGKIDSGSIYGSPAGCRRFL